MMSQGRWDIVGLQAESMESQKSSEELSYRPEHRQTKGFLSEAIRANG